MDPSWIACCAIEIVLVVAGLGFHLLTMNRRSCAADPSYYYHKKRRPHQLGKTAASVLIPSATPAAGSGCKFKLKIYWTAFTCCVCMMDSYETKRYRCDHCDLARHERCIRLEKNIKINSSCPISHWKDKVLELHDKSHIIGKHKSTNERCMVCRMPIKHYSYQHLKNKCEKDIIMHPYCADLITQSEGSSSSTLKLKDGEKHNCFWCGKKYPCCSYLLKTSDRRASEEYIHVYCYSEMVIQALKSIVPSEHSNNDSLRIVVKKKRSDGGAILGWEVIAEIAEVALDQVVGGVGLIPSISWFLNTDMQIL